MSQTYDDLDSHMSLNPQKKINEEKETNKPSSVKKALNWLFLSEYKE